MQYLYFEKRVNSRAEICFWADRKRLGQSSMTQAKYHVPVISQNYHTKRQINLITESGLTVTWSFKEKIAS